MNHFGRKATLGAVAFAMVGSTLFGGAALANDRNHGKDGKEGFTVTNTGGAGGAGGYAPNNCFQPTTFGGGLITLSLPSIGLLGDVNASQNNNPVCVSNAPGGAGGNVE
jgi:hypothetical protein